MKDIIKKPPAYIAFIAVLSTSTSSILVRLSDAPSIVIACYRMIFSVLLCLPFLILERRNLKKISKKDFWLCVLSGLFLALHFGAWITSLSMTTVAASSALVATSPIFVAVISAILFRKKPSIVIILSLMATIAGTIVVAFGGGEALLGSLNGNILAVLGGLAVAVYLVIGSIVRKNVTSGIYIFIVYTFAAIFLTIFCIGIKVPLAPYPPQAFLTIFAMAVFCSLGGHAVFNWMLKYHEPMLISIASLCEPIFASVWALLLLKEIPTFTTVIGAIMIIAGTWYYIMSERGQNEA